MSVRLYSPTLFLNERAQIGLKEKIARFHLRFENIRVCQIFKMLRVTDDLKLIRMGQFCDKIAKSAFSSLIIRFYRDELQKCRPIKYFKESMMTVSIGNCNKFIFTFALDIQM
jgi:hypothetical protein